MKETARVPPLLDSPQSAAPETFLSRDAVSAFPLLCGPLPQSLPGVRCRESAALERLTWRFFVSSSPPRCGRGGRPADFPASSSQFRPPLSGVSGFMRMSRGAAQRNENPRSGLSSSRLEIPRSAITPPKGGNFISAATSPIFENSRVHQNHLFLIWLQSLPRNFKCLRVPIQPHQTPARQPPRNFNRVTAGSGRRIHIRRFRLDTKPLDHFFQQNRRMQNAQNLVPFQLSAAMRCHPPLEIRTAERFPRPWTSRVGTGTRCPVRPKLVRLPPSSGYGSFVPGTARDSRLPDM